VPSAPSFTVSGRRRAGSPSIEGTQSEAVYSERYCLLVRRDNPLAGRESVTWAEPANQLLDRMTR
jgi:hypothetical protein